MPDGRYRPRDAETAVRTGFRVVADLVGVPVHRFGGGVRSRARSKPASAPVLVGCVDMTTSRVAEVDRRGMVLVEDGLLC